MRYLPLDSTICAEIDRAFSHFHHTRAQVITEYKDSELDLVLEATERMHEHLTAAVVSNDVLFTQASEMLIVQCAIRNKRL